MRFARGHKSTTRARIIEEASRAFRREGAGGVSVGDVMRRAGLTHGGFYAHFESKDELLAEACRHGLDQSAETVFRAIEDGARPTVEDVLARYLSRGHTEDAETGCVIPALAADVARGPAGVRRAFTEALSGYIEQLAATLPDGREHPEDDALALAAGMAGAVLLARAVDEPELARRILSASRAFYSIALGGDGAGGNTGKGQESPEGQGARG